MTNKTVRIRQFAFHDAVKPTPPDLLKDQSPKAYVTDVFSRKGYNMQLNGLICEGKIRLDGWEFNFEDYLKEYIIQRYGSLSIVFAPNRTSLRRIVLRGRDIILAETDRSKKRRRG